MSCEPGFEFGFYAGSRVPPCRHRAGYTSCRNTDQTLAVFWTPPKNLTCNPNISKDHRNSNIKVQTANQKRAKKRWTSSARSGCPRPRRTAPRRNGWNAPGVHACRSRLSCWPLVRLRGAYPSERVCKLRGSQR